VSGPGLVTREATPADAAALLGLMWQLAQFEGYAQHFAVAERDLIERGLAATGAPEFTAIVAEQPPGPPCGYAVVHDLRFTYDLRPTVILKELFVAGVDRGGGAGSALMAAVLAYARRAGAGRLCWNVLPDNARAKAFYRRFGGAPDTEWERWILPLEAAER
jgi:diamine N-acetyltransferase